MTQHDAADQYFTAATDLYCAADAAVRRCCDEVASPQASQTQRALGGMPPDGRAVQAQILCAPSISERSREEVDQLLAEQALFTCSQR
jgi:hypothetical protein